MNDEPAPNTTDQNPADVLPPRPSETPSLPTVDPPSPGRWRELLALVAIVVVADVAVYRGGGYAGWSVLLAAVIPLLWLASPWRDDDGVEPATAEADSSLVLSSGRLGLMFATGGVLLLVAAKLVWLGRPETIVAGLAVLVGWSLAVIGRKPFVLDAVLHGVTSPLSGIAGMAAFRRLARREPTEATSFATRRIEPLSVFLPLIVLVAFAAMFIKANPALSDWIIDSINLVSTRLSGWIAEVVPGPVEILFWGIVFVVGLGLVRPIERRSPLDGLSEIEHRSRAEAQAKSSVFPAFRNTLLSVVALFAAYLAFEFATLWRRDFPDGFYYAGYAHAGAAWLTVALATSTLLLSLMFRGTTLGDPRLPTLKRLAWIWTAENFLLAAAVINRLLIYVDFNGMTRMRVVGFLGVLAVTGGLVMVVVKIARSKGFVWLVRRDLWVLAGAILLFVILPVDRLVHAYNARQVLAGDLRPSVQIAHHPVDAGGQLSILPLLECDDPTIRFGVRALLTLQHEKRARAASRRGEDSNWSHFQYAESALDAALAERSWFGASSDEFDAEAAWEAFREYTWQWY